MARSEKKKGVLSTPLQLEAMCSLSVKGSILRFTLQTKRNFVSLLQLATLLDRESRFEREGYCSETQYTSHGTWPTPK